MANRSSRSSTPALHFSDTDDDAPIRGVRQSSITSPPAVNFSETVRQYSITSPRQLLDAGKTALIQWGIYVCTIIDTAVTFLQHDVATWSFIKNQVYIKTKTNKKYLLHLCILSDVREKWQLIKHRWL
jgi:hypothetical protein